MYVGHQKVKRWDNNGVNSKFLAKGTKVIVFVEFKKTADFLAALLSDSELSSTSIHGDRFQEQREAALKEFRTGKRDILVATNVAARGLGNYIQSMSLSPAKNPTSLQTFKV